MMTHSYSMRWLKPSADEWQSDFVGHWSRARPVLANVPPHTVFSEVLPFTPFLPIQFAEQWRRQRHINLVNYLFDSGPEASALCCQAKEGLSGGVDPCVAFAEWERTVASRCKLIWFIDSVGKDQRGWIFSAWFSQPSHRTRWMSLMSSSVSISASSHLAFTLSLSGLLAAQTLYGSHEKCGHQRMT